MTRTLTKLVLCGLLLALSGCGANYNCKGLPEGVACKSAREVYNATDYAEFLGTNADGTVFKGITPQNSAHFGTVASAVQGYNPTGPIPIRTPEKLMQIWIGPWEDSQGSLHMPTVIYTEIENRKWVIGERTVDPQARLTPLDVRSRVSKTTSTSNDTKGPPADLSELTLNHPLQGE